MRCEIYYTPVYIFTLENSAYGTHQQGSKKAFDPGSTN